MAPPLPCLCFLTFLVAMMAMYVSGNPREDLCRLSFAKVFNMHMYLKISLELCARITNNITPSPPPPPPPNSSILPTPNMLPTQWPQTM